MGIKIFPLPGLHNAFISQPLSLPIWFGLVNNLPHSKPLCFPHLLSLLHRHFAKRSDVNRIWGLQTLVDATVPPEGCLRQPVLVFISLPVECQFLSLLFVAIRTLYQQGYWGISPIDELLQACLEIFKPMDVLPSAGEVSCFGSQMSHGSHTDASSLGHMLQQGAHLPPVG